MKVLAAIVLCCLCATAMAAVVAHAPLLAAPLAPAHYGLPVARAVSYGTAINHGAVLRYGLGPYGYKYGVAAPAVVKYGVPAAPLAHVAPYAYGLHAAPYGYGLGLHV